MMSTLMIMSEEKQCFHHSTQHINLQSKNSEEKTSVLLFLSFVLIFFVCKNFGFNKVHGQMENDVGVVIESTGDLH